MRIDTHIHFWKFDKNRLSWIGKEMKSLQEDYLPEHIQTSFKRNGIDGCIAVEASATEWETHFLVELAKTHPIIKGVVGWVDLSADNLEERIDYFSQFSIIKGWRFHGEEKEPDRLFDSGLKRGLALLKDKRYCLELFIQPDQIVRVIELAMGYPELAFVLDHGGKPDIRHRDLDSWTRSINDLARYPNVYCKLSGFLTLAKWKEWSAGDFYPYLDVLFDSFGADRLLFGSDWPVITLSGIYVQWVSLLEKYMEGKSIEDRDKVFGGNAVKLYRLESLV